MTGRGTLWALAGLAVASSGSGCGESRAPPVLCGGAPCPVERVVTDFFQQRLSWDIDLLVVVDDTPAFASRRTAMREDLSVAARWLETFAPGGLPAVHVAVISGTLPESGDARCSPSPSRAPDCGLAAGSAFLSTQHCGRMPNFARPFGEAFTCLADLGAESCGTFQPLEAIRRALDPVAPELPGFRRAGVQLLVVIVGGADDASERAGALVPIEESVALLESLDKYRSALLAVAGPPVECTDGGTAPEAPRLGRLAEAFGGAGLYVPLCGDHAVLRAFGLFMENVGFRIGSPCMSGVRDVDPAQPGLQAECVAEDHAVDPDAPVSADEVMTKVLPACNGAPPPCWRLLPGGANGCPKDTALFLIDRPTDWCRQTALDVTLSCVGCAHAGDPGCAWGR